MHQVGSLLQFVGGSIGKTAVSGMLIGAFSVAMGMTPGEFAAYIFSNPPDWVFSPWLRIGLVALGMALIWISLRFNLWSKKQQTIDELAEEVSWAITDLLNRNPRPSTFPEVSEWEADFNAWCIRVSKKLENRAFFTRADQLHFDRLGFVQQVNMTANAHFNWLLSMLRLKLDRLREVINWTQQRQR